MCPPKDAAINGVDPSRMLRFTFAPPLDEDPQHADVARRCRSQHRSGAIGVGNVEAAAA